MKILHTSDWHIGRCLHRKDRYDEMEAFLAWLERILNERDVDALLVAGDVFDNTTPSNRAQEIYYGFLQRMARSPSCRHVIITAGNHDSPAFLDAPSDLLRLLNIHVIGRASEPENETLLLRDNDGTPQALVCAVPYLHDRDVRFAGAGDDFRDRQQALVRGIAAHYAAVLDCARGIQAGLPVRVPVVLMGHLFVTGGQVVEGDGVRELYVGTLVQLNKEDVFPSDAAYIALGHLHVPQRVAGLETARYSGSPIPMGFGEAGQQKSVCLVHLEDADTPARVETIPVPVFQRLERVHGEWDDIEKRLAELRLSGASAWLEVAYEGEGFIEGLSGRIEECLAGCPGLEVICTRDEGRISRTKKFFRGSENAGLDTLSPLDIFERRLDSLGIPEEQRGELRLTYREALLSLNEEREAREERKEHEKHEKHEGKEKITPCPPEPEQGEV